jgi:hypothetical protein
MRLFTPLIALSALALATPSLALTVSAAPNRDQAPHLQQQRGGASGVDLRDTLAGGGRLQPGADFAGSQGPYSQTQTFSFGAVTTTFRTDRLDVHPSADQPLRRPDLFPPEFIQRRR